MKARRLLIAFAALSLSLAACGDDVQFVSVDVGQCFENPQIENDFMSDVDIVDCDAPHLAEVFAHVTVPGDGEFPGATAVTAAAEPCVGDLFESYVGIDYDSSIYYVHTLTPTADSWDAGDRDVLCFVTDASELAASGQIEGSVRDSGR